MIDRVSNAADRDRKTVQFSETVWMPQRDSKLYKIYFRYCRDRGISEKTGWVGRCHFWHVLIILNPLYRVTQRLSGSVGENNAIALGALLAVVLLELGVGLFSGNWWMIPLILGCVLALVGVIAGVILYIYLQSEDDPSLEKAFAEVCDKGHKVTWGGLLALLVGPVIAATMLILFLVHQFFRLRPIKAVGEFVSDHDDAFFWVMCFTFGVGFVGWFLWDLVSMYGWLGVLIGAGKILLGFVVLVAVGAPLMYIGLKMYLRSASFRKLRIDALIEAGQPVPVRGPNIFIRFMRKLKVLLVTIGQFLCLVAVAVQYLYKRVCDRVELPPNPYATVDEEAEAAPTTA